MKWYLQTFKCFSFNQWRSSDTEPHSQSLKPVWIDDSGCGSGSCQADSAPLRGNDHKTILCSALMHCMGRLDDPLHWLLFFYTPTPCPCSWKHSWRNAKWPITASRCASCWRRYRRTAATSQDGDRRPLSEWPMPLLWWVCVQACMCVCEKKTKGLRSGDPNVLSRFYRLPFQCPHFTSSIF